MTLPTSDISMSAIWSEANSPYSSGQLSLLTMSFFSYFAFASLIIKQEMFSIKLYVKLKVRLSTLLAVFLTV